jgi:protein O-mannosyl-transferase
MNSSSDMDLAKNRRRTIWICALLAAVTVAIFIPVVNYDFLNYDDPVYVTVNAHVASGLSWENTAWAFESCFVGNWHPLTWLSHGLDVQLFGLRPGWHHLTNLLFHAANAVLLFLLLQRLTGSAWRSACVAALFALHPLHVESVAWVSERKDVLSAFFFMLTVWAYARYAEKSVISDQWLVSSGQSSRARVAAGGEQTADRRSLITDHRSLFYLLSLSFFALGLMSKPMLVTLPFVLLLLDYWPLQRCQLAPCNLEPSARKFHPSSFILHPLLLEKAPFFALSAVSCVVAFVAQQQGGAVRPLALLSVSQRASNALAACATYLQQTFWPAGLAVFYPLRDTLPVGTVIVAGVVVLGITAWAIYSVRRRPYLVVGWLWFLGMLVPVIGLVQVGMQQVADRYTYLPLIGIFVMVVWEVSDRCSRSRMGSAFLAVAAGGVLLACLVVTRVQVSYWRDSARLFRHALEVTPNNWLAHHSLGHVLLAQEKPDEAIIQYQAAVALQPRPEIRFILGETLSQRGRYEEAAEQFSELLKLRADNVPALVQLGIARARQGKTEEAARAFVEALRLDPADAGAHNSFGNLLAQLGKHEEAVRQFEDAVRFKPDHAGALNNLAISCRKLGRIGDAITHYREAIRLQPDSLEALNNLAWLLAAHPDAQFRNGNEAVELATRACELTKYQNPIPLATLAAAYAETGRFQEAVSFAGQAQELTKGSRGPLADRLSAMLEAYRAGHSYYQP